MVPCGSGKLAQPGGKLDQIAKRHQHPLRSFLSRGCCIARP